MRIIRIIVCSLPILFGTMVGQEQRNNDEPPADFVPVEKEPVVIHKVEPHYPEIALRAGIEGKVWVNIKVDSEGKASEVLVMKSDNPVFDQSAVEAAKQFVFTPAVMHGKPVAVWVSVPFKFTVWDTKEEVKRYADELRTKIDRPTVLIVRGPRALKNLIRYPAAAAANRIEGPVFASVVLTDSMTISVLKLTQGLERTCDAAVLAGISALDFSGEHDLKAAKEGGAVSIVVQFVLPNKK